MAASSTTPKNNSEEFAKRYRLALRRYLKQDSKVIPASAMKLGRDAVALPIEILDLVTLHQQALIDPIIPTKSVAARKCLLRRERAFFAEAIVPIEETHRTAVQQNKKLIRLNRELDQQSLKLTKANQKLSQEVVRGKVVEENLSKSERHTRELLDHSQRLQGELRDLSRRVLVDQEDERKRISRELHDLVAQTLTGINIHLTALKVESKKEGQGFVETISRTQKLVEESVDNVHRFARELRPFLLDDLGLLPALQSFMKGFITETGIRASLSAYPGIEKLSNAKRTVLYRVAQEALTNVARHAEADQVEVCFDKLSNAVCMRIKDDGKSFDVERLMTTRKNMGLGLLGMRERVEMVGGEFSIESSPGSGTTITARIPYRTRIRKPGRS